MSYSIHKGATRPKLIAQIVDEDGDAVNLSGATVKINVGWPGETRIVSNGAVTVTSAPNGLVQFAFSAAQTGTARTYRGQFWITWGDLSTQATDVFDVIVKEIV